MKIFGGFFCLLLFNCQDINKTPIPYYSLSNPDTVYALPEVLREISGLTYVNENTLACVQDEAAIIYYYNLKKKVIDSTVTLGPPGDYEGVEKVDDTYYLLKSNGILIKFVNKSSETFETFLNEEANTEGLCHDIDNNSLLIACKGKSPGLKKHEKAIYSFDLTSHQLTGKPAYIINQKAINNLTFVPSAIAIHPIDKSIYVVSSKGALLVLNNKGEVIYHENLSKKFFTQPEGICFNNEGDMYISNEGSKNGSGTILKFNYRNK
ncbi:MAG TPA: SdiA-regulated domain-containing protein [Cytophagaceae bacterium]